ncbi:MAG TPA: hypothetical protein VGM54_09880 [Chthoniobacter sp.]|jgi:F0F1-type ATP synthase membrane subunit c/vacuolar-type H+-ATPase subunit K
MNWQTWLKSFGAAVIGGASTAGSTWVGISVAQAAGAHVQTPDFKTLGIILASGAVTNALAYLKKSPLPGVTNPNN